MQAWLCIALWARPGPQKGFLHSLAVWAISDFPMIAKFKIFFVKKIFVQMKPSWKALCVNQSEWRTSGLGVPVPEASKVHQEAQRNTTGTLLHWLTFSILRALVPLIPK